MRKIYVILEPHWDPWWTFSSETSEKMGVRNLRKALDIMRENSEFKYVLDQVYLWELFKNHLPERAAELIKRVQEGRIELTCGGYVNPDFNLPSGESILRQLAFCQKVWKEEFGKEAQVVGIMDSFGQSAQLPQIFSKLGLQYHTAKRGPSKDLPAVFLWQGVDGSQIIFDRQPLGHHGILQFPPFSVIPNRENPSERFEKVVRSSRILSFLASRIALYLPDFSLWIALKGSFWRFKSALNYLKGLYPTEEIFVPHGFGFDGAMPFEWIFYLCQVYSKISQDQMKISLPSDFFKALEKHQQKLKIIKGELIGPTKPDGEAYGALPGTFSTRIRTKQIARENERLLYLVELLAVMSYLTKKKFSNFDNFELENLWLLKFRTDFHDSICGSLTDDNYQILNQEAVLLKENCQAIIKKNFEILSPKKAVFNPLPWPRKDLIEKGKKLELVEVGPIGFSSLKNLKPEGRLGFNSETKTLFTPFYKVSWENNNLEVYQLIPFGNSLGKKIGGKITREKFARFRLQNENGDAYFFDLSGEEWDEIQSIKVIECNEFRATLEIKSRLRTLEITQLLQFFAHTPRIDFKVKLNNQEKNIRLQVHLSFAGEIQEVIREIPAGFLKEGESPGQMSWESLFGKKFAYYDNIKCVQNWIFFDKGGGEGVAIFNDGLPEHEIVNNSCLITLLRCLDRVGTEGKGLKKFKPKNVPWRAGAPHPIPLAQEQGEHQFRYAFCQAKREDIVRYCYEFLFPLIFCQGQEDFLFEGGLFSLSDKNVIPLAIKKAEKEEGIIIRLLETEGKSKDIQLKLNPFLPIRSVKLANLKEEIISDLLFERGIIELRLRSQEIITLLFKTK